jgi:lipoprotein-anchoring transpeptidase ErfK/SrfK
MRSLPGCAALAILLAAAPVAAQEAHEKAIATDTQAVVLASTEPAADTGRIGALPVAAAVAAELAVAPPPPPITLMLKADLGAQRLTVVENGHVKHVWPISSGQRGYATSTGTFRPQWMTRMWYSRQWDMAPMPHAIFFNQGTAFHGTAAVGSLGRPASHGCVRLAPGNAAQLYKMVQRHGLVQTKVVVHGTPPGSRVAERSGGSGAQRQGRYATNAPWGAPARRTYGEVSRYGGASPWYRSF